MDICIKKKDSDPVDSRMQCFALDKLTGSADAWLLSIYNISLCGWKCMSSEGDLVLWWGAIALALFRILFSTYGLVVAHTTLSTVRYYDRPYPVPFYLIRTVSTPRSLLRASEVSYSYSITFAPYTHSSYGWAYHCALFTYHSPHFPFWKCCQLRMHSPNRKTAGHLLHNAKQRLANICRALKIFRFEAQY